MDMRQIVFKVAFDRLEIPIRTRNYSKIRDVCYIADKRGLNISPARVEYDPKKKLHILLKHMTMGLFLQENYMMMLLKLKGKLSAG